MKLSTLSWFLLISIILISFQLDNYNKPLNYNYDEMGTQASMNDLLNARIDLSRQLIYILFFFSLIICFIISMKVDVAKR